DIYHNHWSEANPDPQARYPRLSIGSNNNNFRRSTYWQRDMSYIRLKNIEIGYNFPTRLLKPIHLSGVRLYFSGVNLLTFSKFDLWDPEQRNSQGASYPTNRVFNFGLNINL
ncbi:MAG: SusC/RagA family protein, partial [Bacteroides sp.]